MLAKGDDIEERLIRFAVRIVKLSEEIPKTRAGKYLADQVLRSGISPSLNYAEARRAESSADFVHKLKVTLKELNETRVCLIIITESDLLPSSQMAPITQEATELCKIISASIKTSRATTT